VITVYKYSLYPAILITIVDTYFNYCIIKHWKMIQCQPCYDSGRNDVLNGFYLPALKESTGYVKLAGFFSSMAFAVAARGREV